MGVSNSSAATTATEHISSSSQNQSNRSLLLLEDDEDVEAGSAPLITPFPTHGIRLSCFEEFVEECGGMEFLEGLTTEMVCRMFVKPATALAQLSYCELLQMQQHRAVDIPNVYVSHVWKMVFLDVVRTLEHHFRDDPDTVVWFDLFTMNQHKSATMNAAWLSSTFRTGIRDIGRTVVVLGNLDNLAALKRSWCLFEMYVTADTKSKLEVAMNPDHLTKFITEVSRDDRTVMEKLHVAVNIDKSQSTIETDKTHIVEMIRQSVGAFNMNQAIYHQLCDWVISVMKTASIDEPDVVNMLNLTHAIAQVTAERGNKEEAEKLYREGLTKKRMFIGKNHPLILDSMNGLASLYFNEGKFDKAEPLYTDCLENRREILGDKHPGTFASMHNRAILFIEKRQLAEAEQVLMECIQGRREILGKYHADTLESVNLIAIVFSTCSPVKFTRAERYYNECLNGRKETLGGDHPLTLNTMNNLALLYDGQKQYEQAEDLFSQCVRLKTNSLGPNHPSTLKSLHSFGMTYLHQERWEDAERLLGECADKRKEVLGPKHLDTAATMEGWVEALFQQRKYDEAQPVYVSLVMARKDLHGASHPKYTKATTDLRQCRSFLL